VSIRRDLDSVVALSCYELDGQTVVDAAPFVVVTNSNSFIVEVELKSLILEVVLSSP
jgi:hypothetical protein